MGPIPAGGTVAVTGATGFIGGWVVRYLLDQGYRVRACVRDRSVVPAERSIDSPFHAFMADQMGTMARVYTTAGIELDATARAHLERYIAAHPRGKEGQVLYDLRMRCLALEKRQGK